MTNSRGMGVGFSSARIFADPIADTQQLKPRRERPGCSELRHRGHSHHQGLATVARRKEVSAR